MTKIKQLSDSRVSFMLKITPEEIKKATDAVLQEYQAEASFSGFRKGHAPKEMVIAKYGMKIPDEALNKAMQKSYQKFSRENNLEIISPAESKIISEDKEKGLEIEITVEVYPKIKVGDYAKISMGQLKIKVSKEEINLYISQLMKNQSLGTKVSRKSQKGDLVNVFLLGKNKKGAEVLKSQGVGEKLFLGSDNLIPDLEKALLTMKAGETKDNVKVVFPKEKNFGLLAGQTVLFNIDVREVLEINPEKLTKEQIKIIAGSDMDEKKFREIIEKNIFQQKEQEEKKKLIMDYEEKLLKKISGDVPKTWLERGVAERLESIKSSPQYVHNPAKFWEQLGLSEEKFRENLLVQEKNRILLYLAMTEIIEKANIKLNKEDKTKLELIIKQQLSAQKNANPDEVRIMMERNMKIDKYYSELMIKKS